MDKRGDKAAWFALYDCPPPKKKDSKPKSKSAQKASKKSTSGSVAVAFQQNEIWVCGKCKKQFGDADDKVVECSRCCVHYYAPCIFLNDSEYEILQRPDISWYCPICANKVRSTGSTNVSSVESITKKLETLREKFNEKLDKLNTNTNLESITKKLIETSINDLEEKIENKLKNRTAQILLKSHQT